jgi:hypothetical protein
MRSGLLIPKSFRPGVMPKSARGGEASPITAAIINVKLVLQMSYVELIL